MPFQRRRLLTALPLLALAGCAGAPLPRSFRISPSQLQEALASRGPIHQSLAGLLELDGRVAGLRMLPERGKIAADVDFQATGPLLRQTLPGSFELLFGLRYEPSDQTIRATQPELQSLRVPGLSARAQQLLQSALPALSRHLADDAVLHRFSARDIERVQALGLRPSDLTIAPDALVIGFVPAR